MSGFPLTIAKPYAFAKLCLQLRFKSMQSLARIHLYFTHFNTSFSNKLFDFDTIFFTCLNFLFELLKVTIVFN